MDENFRGTFDRSLYIALSSGLKWCACNQNSESDWTARSHTLYPALAHVLYEKNNQREKELIAQYLSRPHTLEKCGSSLPQKCRDELQLLEKPYSCGCCSQLSPSVAWGLQLTPVPWHPSLLTRCNPGWHCTAAPGDGICSHKDKRVLFVLGMLLNQTKPQLFSL